MKEKLPALNNLRRAIGVGLWIAISGCTTYVQETPPPTYVAPPPQPAPVYVAPAPAPVYVAPQPAPAPVVVEQQITPPVVVIQATSDFYAPLAPLGQWETVEGYGSVWVPNGVGAGWRPYCNGHWENTDAGWFWVSNESWGWATYHYGRWDYDSGHGWFWIPQTVWAPAWVSWRSGGGYVGWSALPPRERFERGVRVDVSVDVGPRSGFVFVDQRRFLEPQRPTTVIVNNTTIINKTTIINNKTTINKTVINAGPSVTVIEKASGHPVEKVAVRDLRRNTETPVVAVHPELKTRKTPVPNTAARLTQGQPNAAKPAPAVREPERKPTPPVAKTEPTRPTVAPAPVTGQKAPQPDQRSVQRPSPPPQKTVKTKQPAKKPPVKKAAPKKPEEPKKPDGQ